MKRTPLARKTALRQHSPLKRTGELKRTPLKNGCRIIGSAIDNAQGWSTLPKVNHARAAKRRWRDFGGPYGDVLIPRLPCCVCYPWFYNRPDDVIREAMADVLFDPERFAVVSEPAHYEHSRGAGGDASELCPMCNRHHIGELHVVGVATFAVAHPEHDFPALASRLRRLWLTFNVSEDECEDSGN